MGYNQKIAESNLASLFKSHRHNTDVVGSCYAKQLLRFSKCVLCICLSVMV